MVKNWASNHIPVYFIFREDGKPLSEMQILNMTCVANLMPEILMKRDSCVGILNRMLRYAVTFPSEYSVSISQARVTDVFEDMLSLYDPLSRSRQTHLRYV